MLMFPFCRSACSAIALSFPPLQQNNTFSALAVTLPSAFYEPMLFLTKAGTSARLLFSASPHSKRLPKSLSFKRL
jgi:hypothetical protein